MQGVLREAFLCHGCGKYLPRAWDEEEANDTEREKPGDSFPHPRELMCEMSIGSF